MAETNEFSIILLTDAQTAQAVDDVRSMIPSSPHRDDMPHLTLLRGITTPRPVSDKELVQLLKPFLDRLFDQPLTAVVTEVVNKVGHFYGESSAILMQEMETIRQKYQELIAYLVSHNFEIEERALTERKPHISVRLGVPFDAEIIKAARDKFPISSRIQFDRAAILRLLLANGQRQMRQIDI